MEAEKVSGEVVLQKEECDDKENLCLAMKKDSDLLEKGRRDVKDEVKRLVIENGEKVQKLKQLQGSLV
ncbi:MAG: hypothetical protein KDK61_08865 [Simkania sp.]|nr:hypothetical protein [Simkania sp.]